MATIFDHHISWEEIKKLQRLIPGRQLEDPVLYTTKEDEDLKNADLYRLFNIRGKNEEAERYFDQIEDETLKYFLKY